MSSCEGTTQRGQKKRERESSFFRDTKIEKKRERKREREREIERKRERERERRGLFFVFFLYDESDFFLREKEGVKKHASFQLGTLINSSDTIERRR